MTRGASSPGDRLAETCLDAMLQRQAWISADLRIGLEDAAWFAGYSLGSFRNLLTEGKGPATYRLGGGGHKRTIRIRDLAEWIESRRDEVI